MVASPIGAVRIRVEVFRPEIRIREKIERSANPSGASAREGFFISGRPGRFVEARALGAGGVMAAAGAATIGFEIYGDVVQREDRCFASSQCRFDSDRLHQFAGVAQWESAYLPSRRSPDRSRFPAPLRPSALASGCAL